MNSPTLQTKKSDLKLTRVAVLDAPRRFIVRQTPLGEIGSDEVLIRIEGCGVCGSDLPVWEGRPWFEYPLAPGRPGHEGWGVVEEVGANVTEVAVGQRVAALGVHAYGSHDIVPANQVIALPSSLHDQPFPAEPLACALNAFARCEIARGQDVAVIGIGFLGALLIQLASHAGARVTAFSRRDFALDIATACGAASTVRWDDSSAEAESLSERFPRVIEVTGMQRALDLATRLVSIRGRLIVAGYHQDSPRTIDMQTWNWKGIDVINAHERDPHVYIAGMKAAVEATCDGVIDLQPLLTHAFPINEINHAFQVVHDRPDGFLKAWVRPQWHTF